MCFAATKSAFSRVRATNFIERSLMLESTPIRPLIEEGGQAAPMGQRIGDRLARTDLA